MHVQTRLSFLLPCARAWEWGNIGLHLYISSNTVFAPETPKEDLIFWVLLFKDLGFRTSRCMCIECRTRVTQDMFYLIQNLYADLRVCLVIWLELSVMWPIETSLVPRPHPAFRRFQYCKVGRAYCLFSCEHDVIRKWQIFAEQATFRVFWTNYTLNAWCVRQLPSTS